MDGETETGITLMYMDEKMDSGDALVQEKVEITKNDNIETLSLKLSNLGATMIIKYLEDIITGKIKGGKQDESKVTFAKIIKRADEQLNFLESATAQTNSEVDMKDGGVIDPSTNTLRINARKSTVANVARMLNKLGASPTDIISIMQNLKRAGAINAELEVI